MNKQSKVFDLIFCFLGPTSSTYTSQITTMVQLLNLLSWPVSLIVFVFNSEVEAHPYGSWQAGAQASLRI